MKKYAAAVLAALFFLNVPNGAPIGNVKAEGQPGQEKAMLTDEQKTVLESMHKDMLQKEKEIINKYVEYGIMSKQAGDMLSAHMDKRFEKIKENGYIPPAHFGKNPNQPEAGQRPAS